MCNIRQYWLDKLGFKHFCRYLRPTAYSLRPTASFPNCSLKNGVALVMVLGVLTVMIILAVAFAISMRTERLAAGNALDTVRARQLAQVGLARAMSHIATNQGNQGLLTTPIAGSASYPPWNVTSSYHDVASDAWVENFQPDSVDLSSNSIAVNRAYQPGDLVSLTSSGVLPSPLAGRTPYFVIPVPGKKNIRVAATYDEAMENPPVPVELTDKGSGVHTIRYVTLANREATNFVPRALWNAMMTVAATNAPYCWTNIQVVNVIGADAGGGPIKETNFPGRVAYLILNCSGLLDANFAGGLDSGNNLVARGLGTNPNEIAISAIPDFQENSLPNLNKATTFLDHRKNRDMRYETLPDLYELNHHLGASPPFSTPPSNFMVYSRAPAGYVFTNALVNAGPPPVYSNVFRFPVNLAAPVTEIINADSDRKWLWQKAITNAFTNAGFTPVEAGILYTNLIDYMDQDPIPGNLDGTASANFAIPSMEPVPMFNEIRFLWDGPPADAGDETTVTVSYELWFPYLNTNATIKIDGSIEFGGKTISTIQDAEIIFNSPGYRVSMPFTASVANGPVAPKIVNAAITMNGVPVDRLKSDTILPVSVSQNGVMNRLECLDPRNNFNPSDPNSWRVASSTINDQNDFTREWWTANPNWDADEDMYVANGPLKSVGELGSLVYTNWRTVKLYGPNRSKVLDAFILSTNTAMVIEADDVCRGKINFNSNAAPDALATVFYNMPVDRHPGDDAAAHRLTWDEAQNVVSRLFDPLVGGGYYTNLSDIGRPFTAAADFPYSGATELEREAYFRNTCGLLTTRQQLFTVIIEAQTAAGGIFARNPPRQRAVALVWRDAFTGEMFVRWLKWLKD